MSCIMTFKRIQQRNRLQFIVEALNTEGAPSRNLGSKRIESLDSVELSVDVWSFVRIHKHDSVYVLRFFVVILISGQIK